MNSSSLFFVLETRGLQSVSYWYHKKQRESKEAVNNQFWFMKKLYRYIYVCIVLANDSTNVVKVVDVVVIWSIKKKKIFLIYTTRWCCTYCWHRRCWFLIFEEKIFLKKKGSYFSLILFQVNFLLQLRVQLI